MYIVFFAVRSGPGPICGILMVRTVRFWPNVVLFFLRPNKGGGRFVSFF